jgi:two-component system chemotaxis sensor kinase CheA
MSDEFNNDSMLELYLFESTTLLEGLDAILLEAEQYRRLSTEEINEIFRIMHTIKGSSAMMSFDTIAEVAHRTEDVFSIIRERGINDSNFDGLFDIVLKASEFLETEVRKIQEGSTLSDGAPELLQEIENYEGLLRATCPSPAPKPDLGRMLGGVPGARREPAPVRTPEPAPVRTPEPVAARTPEPAAEPPSPADMPVAPEGGRILGIEPDVTQAAESRPPESRPPAPTVRIPSPAAAPDAENTVYLHIYFNEGARMENIRAFMLANKLSELGRVNRTIPGDLENNAQAADAIIENGLYLSFTSRLFREQIESVAKSTLSVESVSFVRKMPDEEGPSAAVTSGAAPPASGFAGPEPAPEATFAGPEPAPAIAQQWTSPEGPETPKTAAPEAAAAGPDAAPVSSSAPAAPVSSSALAAPGSGQETADPAPAQVSATGAITHAPPKQNIISVDITKLDSLLDLVGEIVINESLVAENPDLSGLAPDTLENFNKATRQLGKLTNELQDSVMSVRMVPIQGTFQRMRRGIRDMSKQLGKEVEFSVIGETTEVDKTILDAIGDPIMHLVRNAVDHAIETPEERRAAGKSPIGHVTLSAQNVGGDVIISVSDDGRGLDRDKILAEAESRGLLRKPASEYTDREVHNLITVPGFSTKDHITEYSGRGVGLDVVKVNLERIGGSVIIESVKGLGTNILMKIPLTLAIIECMEIRIGKEIFAIPLNNIKESFKPSAGQFIVDPNGNEMIMMRGVVYPIVRLYSKFGINDAVKDIDDGILILTDATDREGCLFADELLGKFQVVVKSIPPYLKKFGVKSSGVSGCTIMGNGDVSLILDVQELLS